MDELIKITEQDGKQAVSARELYKFLGIETPFTMWAERMFEYGFSEGADYVSLSQKSDKPQGGRPSIDYALTIECAKEISMLQRNEKGKQARQYFIAVEKRYKDLQQTGGFQVPASFKEALLLAARQQEQIEEQQRQIEQKDEKIAQDAPKVLFADAVSTSKRSCLVAELAIPCKKKGGRKHFVDLTGKRFGKLLVIKETGIDKWGSVLWECKCDCGNMYIARSGKLVQGRTTNCGCYTSELRSKSATKHGLLKHGIKPRTFIVWNGIKARCLNKNSKSYKNYGARGITICDEWLCYENFHNWALRNGYKDNLSIDRIDNSKGYNPDNCQWIPWKENLMKQRRYILLTVNGETKTLSEWGRFVSVSRWMLTKYFHLKGKKETEKAIADCMQSNKGQVYFVNKFIKTA